MRKKKTLLLFSSFFALLICSTVLLPSFFSTELGKQTLLSLINRRLPGKIEIQTLSLSWFSNQEIQGITYKDTDNSLEISCPNIFCSSSLWRSLFSSDLGVISLQSPNIEVHPTLTAPALPKKPQVQAASLIGSLPIHDLLPNIKISNTCDLQIEQGKVSVFSDKTSSILIDGIKGRISSRNNSLFIKVEGNTKKQNLEGSLFIEASWTLDTSLDVQANIKHFPLDSADAIWAAFNPIYQGYLTSLAGPLLDLDCHIKMDQEECQASLQIKSENIYAQIQTELKEQELTLSSPAIFRCSVSQEFLKKAQKTIPSLKNFPLNNSCTISFSLDQLHIPKTDTGIAFSKASFEGKMGIKPYLLSDMTLGCEGRFSSPMISEEIFTHLDVRLQKKKEESNSYLEICLKTPLASTRHGIASLHLEKTPTSFLKSLFPESSLVTDVLGSYVEAEGSLQRDTFSLSVHSEHLQIPKATLLWKDKIFSLKDPIQIQYSLTPSSIPHFLPSSSITLKNPSSIEMNLSSLQYSSLQEIKMLANISASPLIFTNFFSLKNYEIQDFSCHLETRSLSHISLKCTSNPFDLSFEGGADLVNHILFWEKPIQMRYMLSEQILELIYLRAQHPKLIRNAPCYLEIDPENYSWLAPSFDQMHLKAHLKIPTLTLENPTSSKKSVLIQNLESSFELIGSQNTVKASLSSELDQGQVTCEANVEKIFSKDPKIHARLKLKDLPTQIFDTAIPSWIALSPFIGDSLEATLQIEGTSENKSCWIEGKSPFLQITGGVNIDAQGIFLAKAKAPLQIQFELTPAAYKMLEKQTTRPFALEKNAVIKATISDLKCPFVSAKAKVPDLKRLMIQAQVENKEISFQHKDTKKLLQLQNSELTLEKKEEKTPLILRLATYSEGIQKGSLHIEALCKELFSPEGNVHLSHIHCDVNAFFKTFPSAVLDIAFPSKKQKNPFTNLLGPSFNLSLKTSLQNATGPLSLQFNSSNVQFGLEGALKAGNLLLSKNIQLECAITPTTSRVLLQGVNPLSISSLSSSSPATIDIDSRGFSFPLAPFSIKALQIPQGRINLGKLSCHNEGNVNFTLGLLKSKQLSPNEPLVLWFAPLDFHIKQGLAQIDRTEILIANTYDIALWGLIDVPANRVNMNLGLTAACLKAALNIKDLPSDYVLHIPLTGTLDHVDLNKKVATSKIVALTLWQNRELAGSVAGGGFVGGLINQALTPPGNDGPTPPAKHPFPWESSR